MLQKSSGFCYYPMDFILFLHTVNFRKFDGKNKKKEGKTTQTIYAEFHFSSLAQIWDLCDFGPSILKRSILVFQISKV